MVDPAPIHPLPTKTVVKAVPKPVKFRIEEILPSSIVDVWRLYEQSMKVSPFDYPSIHEESTELIRARMFQLITSPVCIGYIAKQGKKPIGQLIGVIHHRPYGAPRIYLMLTTLWIDPAYRKTGVAKALVQAVSSAAKNKGVHHFETSVDVDRVPMIQEFIGDRGKVAFHTIVGKLTKE